MPISRALIVDDSRTAQHKLKKLLCRYQLEVDLAASAEAALGYLSYRMPSVIFMDHHMEGMDGFEALRIIKANPSTATIPVIMYTAKGDNDELYAGQAHALGALDTLSKNLMKPARVEEVLAKLHIFPQQQANGEGNVPANFAAREQIGGQVKGHATEHITEPANDGQPMGASLELDQMERINSGFKSQIARLFELHIADVRTQISENTKFIVRRLADEIRSSPAQNREDQTPALVDTQLPPNASSPAMSTLLLVLILIALVTIFFQVLQSQRQTGELADYYEQLAISSQEGDSQFNPQANTNNNAGANSLNNQSLLDTLAWAMGTDMHFDYGEAPLGEKQILNLQSLTFRLYEAGFRGLVELNIRFGNYCLVRADNGEWALPQASLPVSQCTFLRNQGVDLSAENYMTLSYLRFEQTAAPVQSGDVEFIINVSAFENPIFTYPDIRPNMTAGQWNAIARQNQQIALIIEQAD